MRIFVNTAAGSDVDEWRPYTPRTAESTQRTGHPSARTTLEKRSADAKRGVGPTVFDWLVDAIRNENPKIEWYLNDLSTGP